MKGLNNSHQLYTQALRDPSKISEEDLLQLIVRYPYSQPLIFAYEKRKKQTGESSPNKSLALLYASSVSWLWNFVNTPSEEEIEESIVVEQEDTVEVVENSIDIEFTVSSNEIVETEEEIESNIAEASAKAKNELDELHLLMSQGSVMVDYFIFDKTEVKTDQNEIAIVAKQDDADDVTVYDDDLLPYSFRWWLQKTRLEHADIYRPYSTIKLQKHKSGQFDFQRIDESILDQQIKENIIHFQEPEAKLSEEVKKRPVDASLSKKTDSIIERFIREEPIIQAPSPENLNNENMARQSAEDNYVFVTETLANIYKDQGLFQKAIEVFRKLILKYPEKKSYFAHRIQELEKNL